MSLVALQTGENCLATAPILTKKLVWLESVSLFPFPERVQWWHLETKTRDKMEVSWCTGYRGGKLAYWDSHTVVFSAEIGLKFVDTANATKPHQLLPTAVEGDTIACFSIAPLASLAAYADERLRPAVYVIDSITKSTRAKILRGPCVCCRRIRDVCPSGPQLILLVASQVTNASSMAIWPYHRMENSC